MAGRLLARSVLVLAWTAPLLASEGAEGSGQGASALITPEVGLMFWTLVTFLILLVLLAKFAWGPILMGLNRREQAIIARIEAAKSSADEAAAQLAEYRAKLAAAGQEAQELLAKARRDGEASADAIRRAAQDAAARERDRAIADIQAAKNVAVAEIGRHAADLAVKLAGRIVRRELSPQDHSAMIVEALEKFPSQN